MPHRLTRFPLAIAASLCAAVEPSYAQIVIHSTADLQGVRNNMAASYVLDADVDLSSVVNFVPIGVSGGADPIPFTGTLDGGGHAITGLTQISSGRYAGLLGAIGAGGSVKNLRIQGASITSNYGGGSAATGNPIPGLIGILAGENRQGTIDMVAVNGSIVSASAGSACGGLVGVNLGTISNSSSSVTITATLNDSATGLLDQSTQIGAIAGRNNAAITNVSAAGTISVKLNATVSSRAVFGAQIGGLVGLSDSASNISGSSSSVNISAAFSGDAHATPADYPFTAYWNAIGGLVGNAPSTSSIVDSSSSGAVTVTNAVTPSGGGVLDAVGGLLGSGGSQVVGSGEPVIVNPAGTPTITGGSASGPITATGGNPIVGGLVGQFSGTIVSSHSSGSVDVTGDGYNGVGGLVGWMFSGNLTDVQASGSVTSVNTRVGVDVGGLAGTTGAVVTNAISSGAVSSSLTLNLPAGFQADSTIGGLAGFNHGVIKNATALGSVTATFAGSVSDSNSRSGDQVGGLVANNAGSISNSSASGSVSLTSTVATSNGGASSKEAGGLVGGGFNDPSFGTSTVTNSFATGAVSASGVGDRLMVGALMGYNSSSIASSYALGKLSVQGGVERSVGGLVGRNDVQGSISSSYWDLNQTGLTIGVGSGTTTGTTSWSAAPTAVPAGFDPTIWGLTPTVNNGYPCLRSQSACAAQALGPTPVVEFYNASLDHYFITWLPDEMVKLDAGTSIRGWQRTGYQFNTYANAKPGTSPVCRYYIPPAQGDSHFFGRGIAECNSTGQKNPSFVLEAAAFMQMYLPVGGVCPPNTVEVYRVFDNRPDANHRYMTDRAVRDAMVVKGWIAEGDGPDLVVMCAPQ